MLLIKCNKLEEEKLEIKNENYYLNHFENSIY